MSRIVETGAWYVMSTSQPSVPTELKGLTMQPVRDLRVTNDSRLRQG